MQSCSASPVKSTTREGNFSSVHVLAATRLAIPETGRSLPSAEVHVLILAVTFLTPADKCSELRCAGLVVSSPCSKNGHSAQSSTLARVANPCQTRMSHNATQKMGRSLSDQYPGSTERWTTNTLRNTDVHIGACSDDLHTTMHVHKRW